MYSGELRGKREVLTGNDKNGVGKRQLDEGRGRSLNSEKKRER